MSEYIDVGVILVFYISNGVQRDLRGRLIPANLVAVKAMHVEQNVGRNQLNAVYLKTAPIICYSTQKTAPRLRQIAVQLVKRNRCAPEKRTLLQKAGDLILGKTGRTAAKLRRAAGLGKTLLPFRVAPVKRLNVAGACLDPDTPDYKD
jgi:hypothetical protein